ncbi:hypothetical protein PRIEUP_LOCUS155, partial [Pristimantis euphronides]
MSAADADLLSLGFLSLTPLLLSPVIFLAGSLQPAGTVCSTLRPDYTPVRSGAGLALLRDYMSVWCPSVVQWCPSVVQWCPSVVQWCPSVVQWCPSVVQWCPSVVQWCPSVVQRCPSVVQRCLSVVQRCLSVVQRCLSVVQRCLSVVQRCLSVVQRCRSVVHKLGIFSRSSESDFEWLKILLESGYFRDAVGNVQPYHISNTGFQQFITNVYKCSFGILYHTKNRGRLNITDVTDSLYDEELDFMSRMLNKKVIVVLDDMQDDSGKSQIQDSQPSIREKASGLFLFTTDEKKASQRRRAKRERNRASQKSQPKRAKQSKPKRAKQSKPKRAETRASQRERNRASQRERNRASQRERNRASQRERNRASQRSERNRASQRERNRAS